MNGAAVVLTSVPFVAASFPIRINSEVARLNEGIHELALAKNTRFLDLNALTAENGQLAAEDTIEGRHLSKKAYEKWASALRSLLHQIKAMTR
jgi:lysophospholipase L1-like esterase